MAQIIPPDFERLSGCFVGAAEECARLQNLPSIDNSQRLLDLMGELRGDMHQRAEQHTAQLVTIQADIASLRADFTSLRADVTTLRVDVADMQTAFTARWDASEANTVARLYNSTVNNSTTPFYPLQNRRNEPVDGFPLNGEELANLSRNDVTNLLRAYELPTNGGAVEKKKRLGQFIGVVVQVF